jgi:hypothetical protein
MNYSIITTTTNPIKLHQIVPNIKKQTIQPKCWHIYNDSNSEINIDFGKIKTKIYDKNPNNYWYYKRLAINLNKIITPLMKTKEWKQIDCVLKLDDDTLLPKNYIADLKPFIKNSNFGCVSGKILSKKGNKYIKEKRVNHYAIGTGMLIKKEIFEYLKGYPEIAGSDTLLNLTSRILGYQNQQLNHINLKQTRLTCGNSGLDRTMASAIKQYYLKYPLWIILFNFKRNYKTNFIKKWRDYVKIIKTIKEKERLQDKKIISYNKKRLYFIILRDIRRKLYGY